MIGTTIRTREQYHTMTPSVAVLVMTMVMVVGIPAVAWFYPDLHLVPPEPAIRSLSLLDPKTVQIKTPTATTTTTTGSGDNVDFRLFVQSHTEIHQRIQDWMASLPDLYKRAEQTDQSTIEQFFPFEPLVDCTELSEVGVTLPVRRRDPDKKACGLHTNPAFQRRDCVVYSFGSNNNFRFEHGILHDTECEVHTFDCTGPLDRFTKIPQNERMHFHHVCLSDRAVQPPPSCDDDHQICGPIKTFAQIQKELGHEKIEILKIDIEGFEVPVLASWYEGIDAPGYGRLPDQILMELHSKTAFSGIADRNVPSTNGLFTIRTTPQLVTMQKMLMEMGYVVAATTENIRCPFCIELTLVRI